MRVASTVEIGVGTCGVVEILRGFVLELDTAVGAPVFFGLNRQFVFFVYSNFNFTHHIRGRSP